LSLVADAATIEAARRELARRSFPKFACMVDIPTLPPDEEELGEDDPFPVRRLTSGLAAHHALLCQKLQEIESGTLQNLMVLMPPGSAKSTYVDVVFVPWFMAKRKRRHVILASYASDIAGKQGRRARQLIKSQSFQNLMGGVTLTADHRAADEWSLTNGSEYMAGGLLSGLTGNRASLGVLDDPIRGREAAESETIRKKTWEAYQDDFCSRLIPGAPQIMILTRWHEDDPAGRILPEKWDGESGWIDGRDGRKWFVICLPAICDRNDDPLGREIGESLWPEWFGRQTGDPLLHWLPFQKDHRGWSSLYQQKPSPEDGTFFSKDWFPSWKERPKHLRVYGSSDYAVSEGKGDYTVHRVWGIDADDNLYRLDGWRGQTSSDKWIDRKLDLIQLHKPLAWFGESGVIQKAIEPALRKRMNERNVFCRLEWLPSVADKPSRARGFQARAAMGKVLFEPDADLSEFMAFPAGKNDDEVDTASLMGRALDQAHPAIVPEAERAGGSNDYGENDYLDAADNWKTA
jgi:predicted phage terminase large subunit-like protein